MWCWWRVTPRSATWESGWAPESALGSRAGAVEAAVRHAGARAHRSLLGETVLSGGGFGQVYDAVGSRGSLADAHAGSRTSVDAWCWSAGRRSIGRLDWTLAWTRELRIEGTYAYGAEPSKPGSPHTMDIALQLMAAHPEMPFGEMVTHRFRLEDWPRAMRTALNRGRSGAIKVVFEP